MYIENKITRNKDKKETSILFSELLDILPKGVILFTPCITCMQNLVLNTSRPKNAKGFILPLLWFCSGLTI